MLLTAINSIRRRVDGERQVIDPRQVFEAGDVEAKTYIDTEAAREPTDEEIALYKMGRPKPPKAAPTVVDPTVEPVTEVAEDAAAAVETIKLKPKKTGDVWVVVDEADTVVWAETFVSRAAAVAWAKANPVEASAELNLLD